MVLRGGDPIIIIICCLMYFPPRKSPCLMCRDEGITASVRDGSANARSPPLEHSRRQQRKTLVSCKAVPYTRTPKAYTVDTRYFTIHGSLRRVFARIKY